MKNKKYSKIIVLALSLALLIGAAIGIAASAETSTEPVIIKKNIEYGGTLKFMVAVEPDSVGGTDKTVTLSVYQGDPSAEGATLLGQPSVAEYDADVTDTNLGVDDAYIATASYGISALAYGQEYYLVVECDGVQTVTTYSAVEYFLNRLYGDDVINATTDLGIAQKALYQNAISYGSSAQTVAELEDTTLDTGTNVADYVWVAAQDGTVNGKASAVVTKGDAITFAYTGTEDASGLAYWLDPNGTKTATATASGLYTARFADFTFSDLSTTATFTPSTVSSTGLKGVTVADGDKDVSKYAGLLYGDVGAVGRTYSYSITEDGRLKYATPQGGTALGFVNSKNYESGHNYSVFEADIQLDLGKSASTGNQLTNCTMTCDIKQTSSSTMYRFVMNYKASSGNLEMYFQRNNVYTGVSYKDTSHVEFNIAETNDYSVSYKLKIEQYYIAATADTVCVISINDDPFMIADTRAIAYEGDCPTTDADVSIYRNSDGFYVVPFAHYAKSTTDDTPNFATSFRGITINPNSNYVCDLYFDNIIYEASVVETIPTYNIAKPE